MSPLSFIYVVSVNSAVTYFWNVGHFINFGLETDDHLLTYFERSLLKS